MDWYADSRVAGAVAHLQDAIGDHIQRQAVHPAGAELALPLVADAVSSARRQGSGLWASLTWEEPSPTVTLRPLSDADAASRLTEGSALQPGLWAAHEHTAELAGLSDGGWTTTLHLPVTRAPEADIDPAPHPGFAASPPANFPGMVAAAMTAGAERGLTTLEAAATAGASAAEQAEQDFCDAHDGTRPANAREVADAFIEFQRSAGGDFFLVDATDTRAVVGNRRCPFGRAVAGAPAMCRSTSALLGSLGARASGSAAVVLDERLATGDLECRAVLELDGEGSPVAHRYRWPARGVAGGKAGTVAPGFRIVLSLQLPRDRLSVPLVRHMVAYALGEVGVVADDSADVELALTEACANVIDHSGPGDAYDVVFSVGPELAEIRVIDIGRGFDHESLAGKTADLESERGRGISLMQVLMDQVRFESEPERGTVVHLIKQLHFDDSVPARRLMLASAAEDEAAAGTEDAGGPEA